MIYFDHAASTPLKASAKDVLLKSLDEDFANPSAAHKLGKSSLKKVDKCRSKILKILKAKKDDQLIFLSSATEANNLIIKGLSLKENDSVHFSKGDHPSTTNPCLNLNCKKVDIELISGGEINTESLLSSIDENSKLVVFSHVNNQSGNLYNVSSLAASIKEKNPNAHIHIDGVQALTKIEVDLSKNIDSYTISGHKLGAPKGVSALFIKKGVELETQLHGGGHEFGLRSSTINTPSILSLSTAIEEGVKNIKVNRERVLEINTYIRDGLSNLNLGIDFPFKLDSTSPYILSFILPGVSSDIVLRHLEMKNIFVASSSACSSRAKGYNAGFDAMKIEEKLHKFVLRVSFNETNTIEEAKSFVKEFESVINDIKRLL
jgi:cysteine desulfurase